MHPEHRNIWKEWSFAKDDHGQHYYCERWERMEGDDLGEGIVLSLRRAKAQDHDTDNQWRDGIIVVIGDHFSIIQGRRGVGYRQQQQDFHTDSKNTLVDLIDACLEQGDRETVEYYLSLDAAHGRVSSGWIIDCAIHYWKEGTRLWNPDLVHVRGQSMDTCRVCIHDTEWEVYESSMEDITSLELFLKSTDTMNGSRLSKL
jgi:hypothetical protein